jgi:hypothetical protein
VHPHIPILFPNLHFPNPILFPLKNIETEVEIGFFRPFPSVFIATHKVGASRTPCHLPKTLALSDLCLLDASCGLEHAASVDG